MHYIFDTNTFVTIFKNYYVDRFPSFWDRFNNYIEEELISSVREVRREIAAQDDYLNEWSKNNKHIFSIPSPTELAFITQIYSVNHFMYNLEKRKRLYGGAFADPFIIAKAQVLNSTVVTQEKFKPNGTKIPNICQHFNIPCCNLEEFLTIENWVF